MTDRPASPQRSPNVLVVMGVSGSGKTSVGSRLADRLGWPFADADGAPEPLSPIQPT